MANLYFNIAGEGEAERAALASRVSTAVANTPLNNEAEFHTAVSYWLNQISGRPLHKRRITAQALAEAAINPTISKDTVFGRGDTVSKAMFYSREKRWVHDEEYRYIVEVLVAIYRKWNEGATLREMMERQTQHRQRMMDQADMILGMGDALYVQAMEALQNFIAPTEITYQQIVQSHAARAKAAVDADKIMRMALGMDTDQTAVSVTAEVAETSTEEIRASMRDKLAQMRLRLPRPAQPAEEPEDENAQSEQ